MTAFAHIDGHTVVEATVHVPGVGPWWAEVELEQAPDLSGRVTLVIGALELVGTISPDHSVAFGLVRRMRIVAGAGGWGTLLVARHYHNDAQIRARLVAEDAAREAGETLGDFSPAAERVGVDYVRTAGAASRALEDAIGGVAWWVGYDGATRVGTRATSTPAPSSYDVLDVVADDRIVELTVDDPRAVGIGSILENVRLDEPMTVRELELRVRGTEVRARAWCGGQAGARGRVAGALRALVRHIVSEQLWGVWKYRVVRVSVDRLELQAVNRADGVPDALPISMWPGAAGVHSEPAPGAEVLVQFIGGRRTEPIVTHFAGKDGHGWTPANTTIDVASLLKLGANAAQFVALANLVRGELNKIQATLATGTVANESGPGTTPVLWGTPYSASDVAATKVKAE